MALTNQTIGAGGVAGGTWTIQNANTAMIGRYHDLSFLLEGAAGTSGFTQARTGCLTGPSDSGSLTPNCFAAAPAGGLSVNIRRGAAVVERTTLVGPYLVHTEATGQITLGTADAVNPRIDRVDLQVLDGALGDNGGVSLTRFLVTPGVAAGTPTIAAQPNNSISVLAVTLPANTTTITAGMITDLRTSTGLRDGVRYYLPGDSLSAAGFMAGELRNTLAATTPGTIDMWNPSTSSWQRIVDLSGAVTVYTNFDLSHTLATTNSNTFTALLDTSGNSCGHSFIAPASGKVRITWGGNFFTSVIGSTVYIGTAVKTGATVGAGTLVSDVVDGECQGYSDNNADVGSRDRIVTGLTPGNTYNVRLSWRNTGAATANGNRPFVITTPLPQ